MKAFFLSLLLFTFCIHLNAQNFAPVGAEWYYVKWISSNNRPPYSTDFIMVRCIGDTTIEGRKCSILKCYDNGITPCDSSGLIVYGDSNEIGFYKKSNFSTRSFWPVMHFNVLPGDTVTGYTCTNAYEMPRCGPAGHVPGDIDSFRYVVGSVSYFSVQGKMLKQISIEANPQFYDPYVDVRPPLIYFERIGSMREKFMIEDPVFFPGGWHGYLRCYKDLEITYKADGVTAACDAYAVKPANKREHVHVFPNPASKSLTIASVKPWPADTQFELLNMLGQPVLAGQPGPFTQQSIDVQRLPAGSYLLLISNREQSYRQVVTVGH